MRATTNRFLLALRGKLGQPYSLRRNLMSSAGVFVVAILLSLGLGIAYFVYRTEQDAWRGRQVEAARSAAKTVGGLIQRTEDALSLADALSGEDPARWSESMSLLARQNPAILETIRLDGAGQVIAAAAQDRPVLSNLFTIPQSRWFLQARAGQHFHSSVQLSAGGAPFMLIALPTSGDGVLAVRLSMNVLWDAVDAIRFGVSGRAYVVDGQGQMLAFSDRQAVLAATSLQDRPEFNSAMQAPGKEWHGAYTNFEGRPVVAATAPVPDTDWLIFTELSQEEAFAASRKAALVLGSSLVLVSALVAWLTARYLERLIFKPMEKLRDGADEIGKGDLSLRIGLDRRDEIGRVARSFDEMATQLGERQDRLNANAAALRQSEARYRAMVDDQTELICRFTPDGRLTFVNEAYCRYFGQPRQALVGSSLMPLLPPEDQALVQAATMSLSPQNPVVTLQHRVNLPDGSVRWQEWTERALFDETGRLVEFAAVGRDITERELALEALARRARQMDALYTTSLEINAQYDLSTLLHAIIQRAAGLVGTQMGGLYLVREGGESLELVVGLNLPPSFQGTVLRWGEGLAGRVAQTGHAESVGDYQAWPGRAAAYEQATFRRALGVPLKHGDRLIGVISITDDRTSGSFSEEDVQLVSLFADQAVIAIEKARLYEQLQGELGERNRMAEALRDLNQQLEDRVQARTAELAASNAALSHRVSIEQLTSTISTRFVSLGPAEIQEEIQSTLALLGSFAGADHCSLFQFSDGGARMTNTLEWCAQGIMPLKNALQDLPVAQIPWWMEQLAAQQTVHLPRLMDLPAEVEAERQYLHAQSLQSLVAVPLVYNKALNGFLGIASERSEHDWAEEDILLLKVIGQLIANALENQRADDELRATLQALEASEGELRALFAAMNDVVLVYDRQGVYRKVAPTNPRSLIAPATELIGKSVIQTLPPEQAGVILESIGRALNTQRTVSIDYSLPVGGEEVWFAGTFSPTPDGLVVLVARDITDRKRIEEQLQYDAFHDVLTRLPNRALFLDRLGRAIERAHRHAQDASAVLFLDLDRFKVVNDSLGHAAGDELLIAFARRLEGLLRSSDTAARLGGDEFVILLEDLKDPGDAVRVAERIQEVLRTPFQLGSNQAVTSASIGVILETGAYSQALEVLRDADIAMYRAKALGKARYEIFHANFS